MTFEEAIVIAVRKYYAGRDPEELLGTQEGESTYTREYFEELEEELLESGSKKKSKKKKKDDEEQEVEEDEFG
jgi:hypothetical protein